MSGEPNFGEIWLVDFEFSAPPGERPRVVCLVARELFSGQLMRVWEDELAGMAAPPYPVGEDVLFVAYYASAEMGCHLALGWPLPTHVLDLFPEFRCLTNGQSLPMGSGLVGALAWFGLDSIEAVEKNSMRELAIRGGPWTTDEREALLDYCESDVAALERLMVPMRETLDWPRALLRGRSMKAAAHMEHCGVPIDVETLERLRTHWSVLPARLIASVDRDYGVFEGSTFKRQRFEEWLVREEIAWPYSPSGTVKLDDNTFKAMSVLYPQVAPLWELRKTLSQLRLHDLAVGDDGRNRCLLSAFRARTGRNQPSNSKFIFGTAAWLRGLIQPPPGRGVAYVDWCQQEFGIAAALSDDPLMRAAYASGDPYLAFAKQAGAVPAGATKQSHKRERDLFKACVLAVQYGMGEAALAERIGQPVAKARELLMLHRQTYRTFWHWSDAALDYAMLEGELWTVFGWHIGVGLDPNPRSLRNFPMQANGAEMLRLACCLITEAGIRLCAPVHDAVLIEAPLGALDDTIAQAQALMAEASRIVLDGFVLRTDAEVVRHPQRYQDERGVAMWERVLGLLAEIEAEPKAESVPASVLEPTD
ncbi:DNA polymerase [Thiorhodovibrio frisius]|uniref:DNA polymerase I family protein with 3'-5'-exonuclease and polymerase domains n=1 Tax=Thiorhodovibrio frisius TaxID=631362 RepID=H8Z1K1_9GAMM|nr:DNA polymerase [Thiorhodovibrio frisius]EIC21446.1 DNA polymerase I family protein with 3'-5'-exonuclease and polymerase domains [Thiorhodovibrio frisius]WPL24032.1 DNA polymerase I, thermostable [Thiorhodovibrio frisius]